ncbi:integrase [Tetragenococcus koreensis]|uniref:IS21 family transposase n=1 Tax=Tetragenococcus koreensis TaxID=290335 RepID=UPI001195EE83|nr:IS21 family transposase [Tetragenococcus koreensis]GEN92365.1 integrase [Tetragenococcus koreensis]
MPNYLEILRLHELSVSMRQINQSVGSGRNTVSKVLRMAREKQLTYHELSQWEEQRVEEFFRSKATKSSQRQSHFVLPDYEQLAKELAKPGVTMQLLWEEYVDQCRQSNLVYYQLTQFKKYFHEYLAKQPFAHVIHHKAGEKVQVDWAGTKAHWIDPDTGEQIKGDLFVAVLPFSGYSFALVCPNMKQASWIHAHIQCFAFFGGVPTLIIPDNLKVGVTKHTRSEVILNQSYEEFANAYHTVIIPARIRRPRDKGAVENTVKQLTTHLIARMRNYQFFSMEEYNEQLAIELRKFNQKPFQKKTGSRQFIFETIEQAALQPLPIYPYEYGKYKTAKVYANSHISYQKHYYSVPHAYIGKSVTLKIYTKVLKVYDGTTFLCQHDMQYKHPGQYTTEAEHLPENSAHYGDWNSSRYQKWARRIGPNVAIVVERMFLEAKIEQHYYQRVHALLKLADPYSDQRLDQVCQQALEKNSTPSYSLLKSLLEKQAKNASFFQNSTSSTQEQAYLRGADYYDNNFSK